MKFGIMMHLRPLNLMGIQKFQNPIWRAVAILNIEKSRYLRPILTKFCMVAHISPPELTSCSKNKTFKNPSSWTAAILKIVKCDISANV